MNLGISVERAEPLDVSGPLTNAQLRATAVPVSGPLTDTELRAADVKITLDSESVAVTGPLTDTELRATPLFPTDTVTDAIQVITTDHSQIHVGNGFSMYATFSAVADDDTRHVIITTPVSGYLHLKFYDVWCNNAEAMLQLYEDPYSVAGGTALTPSNRRRVGTPDASTATVVHTATLTLDNVDPAHTATLLETLMFGGGGSGPQGRAGGDRSLDVEWVLKPNETYAFVITNLSGSAADIGFWAFWYEENAG